MRTHSPALSSPYEGVACLANARNLYEFGRVTSAPVGPTFFPEEHVPGDVGNGAFHDWRALVRGEFVELYVDNHLVQCFGFSTSPTRNVGFFAERTEVDVSDLRVYPFV